MGFVVETGQGLLYSVSYASLEVAGAYHLLRRNDPWLDVEKSDEDRQGCLVRATAWLDATYRSRFTGYRRKRRDQALEWPRVGAYVSGPDSSGYGFTDLAQDEIPREIVAATCEAALRELVTPGSLSPDLQQGGAVRSVGAGSTSVTFAGGGLTDNMVFQTIDLTLSGLLEAVNTLSSRTGRC